MELKVCVQNYAWGKKGTSSKVAQLYQHNEEAAIDEATPYAELWMGTHPNCPSAIKSTGMDLGCLINNHPEYLGDASITQFGKQLPFLFKVLSVNTALSIQAHPNKQHAEQLHSVKPDLYKDPNHKPELAIALTKFKAMCGFRPFAEIQTHLQAVPELQTLLSCGKYDEFLRVKNETLAGQLLPECFRNLMNSSDDAIATSLTTLVTRFKAKPKQAKLDSSLVELIVKLNDQYPNDVGCFGPLFMNVVDLNPGDAIFLGANEVHAYLEGDCMECMACSDNVVRAGLTPKFKDVQTLCDMLIYEGAPASAKLFKAVVEDEFTQIFRPPVPDFAVAVTRIPKGQEKRLIVRGVASIVIFITGYGHTQDDIVCTSGTVLFIPANGVVNIVDVTEDIVCYQGMSNIQ